MGRNKMILQTIMWKLFLYTSVLCVCVFVVKRNHIYIYSENDNLTRKTAKALKPEKIEKHIYVYRVCLFVVQTYYCFTVVEHVKRLNGFPLSVP